MLVGDHEPSCGTVCRARAPSSAEPNSASSICVLDTLVADSARYVAAVASQCDSDASAESEAERGPMWSFDRQWQQFKNQACFPHPWIG
jgi:hypothetical protein